MALDLLKSSNLEQLAFNGLRDLPDQCQTASYAPVNIVSKLQAIRMLYACIFIFSVLRNAVSFPILVANNILMSLFFWLFTLRSIYGTENSSQQMSLERLSTFNVVFSDEEKILIKS